MKKKKLFNTWEIDSMKAGIFSHLYPHLVELNGQDTTSYSRAEFRIVASRLSGYYVWQVLIPLFIIILASFVIFWLKEKSDQLGIAFTLMLTVVAFNFYSGTLIPKLPYNTFIEMIIFSGYVFIFLTIITITLKNKIIRLAKISYGQMVVSLRIIFPITYFLSMLFIYHEYFNR